MIFEVLFENAINAPSPRAITLTLVIASVFVLVGLVLAFRKRIWLGRSLGLVGLCIIMAALFVIRAQTVVEKPDPSITIKWFRYTEWTRGLALVAMIGLPLAAIPVMRFGFIKVRIRLRRDVPRHLKLGRRYFAQKEYEPALREYNQAIHTSPYLAEAYFRRGVVYLAMGKTAEALTDFDRAIECDPRLGTAYLERGKLRTESGELDAALADFGRLVLIRGSDPDTYLQRGICLAKKGLTNDARADFHRVLKMTNHSDYAEPAKNYLRDLEDRAGRLLTSGPNGMPTSSSSPQPQAQDHAI
jgi:hypothetical protein